MRNEFTKLSGLSSEGRSSATTILALSALKHLIGTDLDERTKKLLAFTDNRQDASLQAGHFNDFVQILLLRGALLAAMRGAGGEPLTDEVLTQKVLFHLRLDPSDYSANPSAKGVKAQNTLKALRDVLGYRLYFDLQRGWRINNPNIEQLGLLEIGYRGLDECCRDEEEWRARHPLLGSIAPEVRFALVRELLERMRRALCIKTIYLDPNFQERMRNRSYNELKEPWGLSEDEIPFSHAYMVPRPSARGRKPEYRTHHVSHRSAFGRKVKSTAYWGTDNPNYAEKFDESVYNNVIDDVLGVLTTYGYVEPSELDGGRVGYRIDGSALEWRAASGDGDGDEGEAEGGVNPFFRDLYENVAGLLGSDDRLFHRLEAREHTAQVESEDREERERRFRHGLAASETRGLPIPVLLADYGIGRGHRDAQRRLHAERAADPGQLRAAERPGGSERAAGARRDLLRGPVTARPVLLRRPDPRGGGRGQSAQHRSGQRGPDPEPPASGLAGGDGREARILGTRRARPGTVRDVAPP